VDAEVVQGLLSVILGTGGIGGMVAGYLATQSRRVKQSGDEHVARQDAAEPDWAGFNTYWQQENARLRRDNTQLKTQMTQAAERALQHAEADAAYIDKLEAHIWMGKPPPPPSRTDKEQP
jgi:hypothetical protein